MLIEKFGAREIFDDMGTFPAGSWLDEFCEGMIKRGYNKKLSFFSNRLSNHTKRLESEIKCMDN